MSTVDVIVPCYNYARYLRECVESVLSQSGPSVRVLIIDDASTDNTAEVASELSKQDQRVVFLQHSVNRGHIATYNEGIDWTSAKYLLLLSADDCLVPGALDRATTLMEKYPNVGLVFGNAIEVDELGQTCYTDAVPCSNSERILTSQEFFRLSGARNIVPTPTAVVRTTLQKAVGGYRTELPHAGDMEMWLRLAAHASVGFVKMPQAVYRQHGTNMSLSYMSHDWLPDLKQRRIAFDCFFETCGHLLKDSVQLREEMHYLLAGYAVNMASKIFNDGKSEACKGLVEFALSTSTKITRSLPWGKFVCKRLLGFRAWRWLKALSALRRPASIQ